MSATLILLAAAVFAATVITPKASATEAQTSPSDPEASGHATVDAKKSRIAWHAKKVIGNSKHNGTIDFRSGSLHFSDGALTAGKFEVNMKTIKNLDLDSDTYRNKLEGHLKSEDFFSVEKFPTATFTITSAKAVENATSGAANYTITGDMKIKGITKKISFPATVTVNGNTVHAKATVTLDRSKWDVRYGSGSFFDNLGDNMIDDNFDLALDIQATM